MAKHIEGLMYESGIALKNATKEVRLNISTKTKNNANVPLSERRCKYYHPKGCRILGHQDARNKLCFANKLSIVERKAFLDLIFKESVEAEVSRNKGIGK